MRLLHYELLRYVSDKCIIGQWGELNTIISKHSDNIMINYVWDYKPKELIDYAGLVLYQMTTRGIKVYNYNILIDYYAEHFEERFTSYYDVDDIVSDIILGALERFNSGDKLFTKHHNDTYLLQCFFNLQEKYTRGATDLTEDIMNSLRTFVGDKFKSTLLKEVIFRDKSLSK